MTLEQIKNKLKTEEYDFLRTDKNLGRNIILLTLGGSYAYGVRYATVQINELKFEITLDNAVIGNSVIVFYSKDNKEQMVYRFAIRKESKNAN